MSNIRFLEKEFLDFLQVLEFGAKKHGDYNWLRPDGKKSSHDDMHASMFRHLAESSAGHRADAETGLDPLLHLASRALMMYTRIKRGIVSDNENCTTAVNTDGMKTQISNLDHIAQRLSPGSKEYYDLMSTIAVMKAMLTREIGELKVHNTTTVEVLDSGEQVLVSRPKKG